MNVLLVVVCPDINVANADVYKTHDGNPAGSLVIVLCMDGFKFIGTNPLLSCQSDGTWNHPVPRCGTCHLINLSFISIMNLKLD